MYPNKTEDLNLSVLNIITEINELKTVTKHMEENVIQINGGITINVDVSVKTVMDIKKVMFGIVLHVILKMENI